MVGTMKRQWYRMTTAEVVRIVSAELSVSQRTKTHIDIQNRPLFLPKNSWYMYRYNVLRDGKTKERAIIDVRMGDIIVVRAGDIVPATARLIKASSLAVKEDMIPGGSSLNYKQTFASKSLLPITEQKNMLFAGTHIISGTAHAIVVANAQDMLITRRAKSVTDRALSRKGITVQNEKAKKLVHKVVAIYFDDLQQPAEIIQLVQHVFMSKGIAVTFFVNTAVARQLRHVLPKAVFGSKNSGVRVATDYSEEQKARMMRQNRQSNDVIMFVHRGVSASYMPKIADINVVIAQHAQHIAIQQADLVMWRISIQKFASILYNKK